MIFRLRTPPPPLGRFVENLWYFEDLEVGHSRERLLPDGAMELIIDLGEGPKRLYDGDDPGRFTPYRRCWISGMHTESLVIGAERGSSLMGARFRTGGAAPFFDFPLSELSGSVIELEAIWKRDILALREQLLEAQGADLRFDLLQAFLMARARARFEPDAALDAALHRLRTWPAISVRGLAADLGLSHKQMISRFGARVGLGPKTVSRLFRFQRAVLAIHAAANRPLDWPDVALEAGYYDQSHFIHEFREFAGVTPTAYAAGRTDQPFYLYLD